MGRCRTCPGRPWRFDGFAASFESKLQKLSYRAPALVAAALERSGLVVSKRLDMLDGGCGTGRCRPLVAPYARRLPWGPRDWSRDRGSAVVARFSGRPLGRLIVLLLLLEENFEFSNRLTVSRPPCRALQREQLPQANAPAGSTEEVEDDCPRQ